MEPARILVVDDEPSILLLLREALTQWGYHVTCVKSAGEALEAIRTELFDAAITDIRMPDMSGLDLLREIKRQDESIEVVMMTGYPTIASAVEALKEGAFDYLSKPLILDELRHLMTRLMERRFLRGEVHSLRARLGEELTVNELIGASQPMQRVKDIIGKVAVTDSPVLIEGESGTGKELVAAAIHRLSSRAKRPFLPVNCSAIPPDLLESEFFGHVRGAFSGAVADALGLFRGANQGTIFLDEIAELSPALQVKLLRVLQEMQVRPVGSTKAYPVDVRVIAATNRDLAAIVREGHFREDLYYRLNVVHFELPPLRARDGDVPILLTAMLRDLAERAGGTAPLVTPEAWAVLEQYQWPGNVRELRNVAQRLMALDDDGRITVTDLPAAILTATRGHPTERVSIDLFSPAQGRAMTQFKAEYVRRMLEQHRGNVTQAARSAGVSRRTFHRWIADLRPAAPEGS